MMLKPVALTITFVLLVCAGGVRVGLAQERPYWGGKVYFPNGTLIQTGIGTVPTGLLGIKVSETSVATAESSSPEEGVFRRILKLSDGRAIIYEITVKRLDDGKQFEVSLKPWVPTSREAREIGIDRSRIETDFLEKYSEPLTVNDGDILALDVLYNPHTGVKLVDYFRIASRAPTVRESISDLSATARSIDIRDVEFLVTNFELRLKGKSLYTSKGGMSGRFVWLDIPKTGRFIFSLTPIAEADGFYRSAYVTGTQIMFTHGADKYVLTAERPIIPASGVFHLWMRLDPTFSFPSPASQQSGDYFSIGAADHLPLQKRE